MDKELLQSYIALGRAQADDRKHQEEINDLQKDDERRREVLESWRPLLDALREVMPPDFAPFIVGPAMTPTQGLNNSFRLLVVDLTPLGLGPLGAVHDPASGRVGWLVPNVITLEDTGQQMMYLSDSIGILTARRGGNLYEFYEALAMLSDIAGQVNAHNERIRAIWRMFDPWLLAPESPVQIDTAHEAGQYLTMEDLYGSLARQGGGCYPVFVIGNDREHVHSEGRQRAVQFGDKFGAADWEKYAAVHTFTLDSPFPDDRDEVYVYLTLIPVALDKWREVMGAKPANDEK